MIQILIRVISTAGVDAAVMSRNLTVKADSDLVLGGWRSLDDLKNDVIAVLNQEIR